MANNFPNLPGVVMTINDGNLRVERAAVGQKITILGVTTANIPLNEPVLLTDASAGRSGLFHPATNTFSSKPSELNAALAETAKGVAVEYVKIAHGWGDEGLLYFDETDFDGHILTEQERYQALQETFDVLLNHDMDAIFCAGIFLNSKPDLVEIMDADGTTPTYGSLDGDFAYQLADFCDESTAENHTVIGALGKLPIRIEQFRASVKTDYYDKFSIVQDIANTVTAGTKTIVLDGALVGNDLPFHGSSITIHYPTGTRTYTVDTFDAVDTIVVIEVPLESTVPVNVAFQAFDETAGAYTTFTTAIQAEYRLAFRGYHPTDTLSTSIPTLFEFQNYYNDAVVFKDNTNIDGVTAAAGAILPTNYRMFKMIGGAATNPNGGTGDILDGNEQKIDLGKWISMGALEGTSSNSFGDQTLNLIGFASESRYVSTGMGEYMGMVLRLRENDSSTNKPIDGFISNRDMKRSLADSVAAARYIFARRRPGGRFVVGVGDTGAYNIDENRRSDFVRLTTVRISGAIIKASRAVIDPYIGGPSSSQMIAAIRSELDEMFQLFVRDGFIANNYEFQFLQSADSAVLGQATLLQNISPAFELRKVFGELNLKK